MDVRDASVDPLLRAFPLDRIKPTFIYYRHPKDRGKPSAALRSYLMGCALLLTNSLPKPLTSYRKSLRRALCFDGPVAAAQAGLLDLCALGDVRLG